MSLFKTTDEQFVEASAVFATMRESGLPASFIRPVGDLARQDQGIFELVMLWRDANTSGDAEERDAVVADLQEHLDDAQQAPAEPQEKPYIKFDDLPELTQKVMLHKEKLRDLIDQHGGISAVARTSGIPQPSLSRMLSSPSMPRKTTLHKLAKAMGLSEMDVVTEWTR